MASAQETIEIVFNGIDDTGRAFGSVGRGLDDLSSRVGDVTGPMASITDTVLKLDAALAAVGATALAFAVTQSIELESATLDLQKVLADSEGSVEDYRSQITELSETYGVLEKDVVDSVAEFKQAGFDINESLELTEQSLVAVKISELDAAEASDYLVAILKGFKAPASEAGRLLDVLNETSNHYSTSVGELASGMARVSPIAETMGFSFEETAGILTPVIEVFRSGNESANALRTGLLKLTADTKPVQEALAALGVSQRDANGEMRSGKEILRDVQEAFKGLSAEEQSYYTQQLVGINQAAKMQIVFSDSAKAMAVTEDAMNSTGSAAEELAVRMQAAEEQLNRAKSSFNAAATAVGDQFLASTKDAIGGTAELSSAFRDLVASGGLEPLFASLRPIIDGFNEDLRNIAENLPAAFEQIDFNSLTTSFDNLGSEIGDIFENVDLSTPEGLADVIQQLIDIGAGLVNVSAGIVDGLTPFIQGLASAADTASDLDDSTQSTIGQLLGLGKGIDTLLPSLSSLGGAIDSVGTGMTALAGASGLKTVTGMMTNATGATNKFKGALGKAGLAGVALWSADQVVELGGAVNGYLDATNEAEAAEARYQETLRSVGEMIKETSDRTGIAMETLDDFTQAKRDDLIVWDETTERWVKASEAAREQGDALEELNEKAGQRDYEAEVNGMTAISDGMAAVNDVLGEHGQKLTDTGEVVSEFTKDTEEAAGETRNLQAILDDDGNIIGYADAVDGTGTAFASMAKEASGAKGELQSVSDEAEISAEKLAELENDMAQAELQATVDLSIAEFEANSEVAVAQAEAAAQGIQAAFDSTEATINSTGQLIGDLFGALGEADSFREAWMIEDQLKKENDRRQEALDLQAEMTKEQIALLRAQRERIESGDSVLNIQADGLKPHLEAIWFDILEALQVRASEEGAELLLGVCS